MTRLIQIVFALMVIVIGLAFHIKNEALVSLDFYAMTINDVPLSGVVVAAFGIGVLLGAGIVYGSVIRLRYEIRRISRKHEIAAKEIVNLRAIPINDAP